MKLIPYFHNRHSEQSRGCNAAAEGGEARLSIPLPNSPVTSRDVSRPSHKATAWQATSLDMTGGRTLQSNCTPHVIHSRGHRFQFFHSLDNHVWILQAVSGDCANDATRLRNSLE